MHWHPASKPKSPLIVNCKAGNLRPIFPSKPLAQRRVSTHKQSVRDLFTSQSGLDIMLSPWIMAHFNVIALIVLVTWFTLLRVAYNIDFLRLGNKPSLRFIYWFVVVFVSLALIGYSVYFVSTRHFNEMTDVASVLSPDGRHRATVLRSAWVDIIYDVVLESNEPTPPFANHIPLLAQEIGGVSFGNNEPSGSARLIWSQDSRVVTLWFGNTPMFGYDLRRQTVLDPSSNAEVFRSLSGR
jgi:hypothetical protein